MQIACHCKCVLAFFTFSRHGAFLEAFIYRKRSLLWTHKARKGLRNLVCYDCTDLAPCCFLRRVCDLKDSKYWQKAWQEFFMTCPEHIVLGIVSNYASEYAKWGFHMWYIYYLKKKSLTIQFTYSAAVIVSSWVHKMSNFEADALLQGMFAYLKNNYCSFQVY